MSDSDSFDAAYQAALRPLADEFRDIESSLALAFPESDSLRAEMGAFVKRGGKRFRPVLSFIVAQSLGCSVIKPHLSLELFHKYLLAHDDIIDEDAARYNAPTLHAAMAKGHGKHFGESMGIIGGDLLASASYRAILDSPISNDRKVALLNLLATATEEVAWGWYDQFLMDSLPLGDTTLTYERIEQSIIWVTGKYSIKLPLLFGYALADSKAPDLLEPLADTLGALYQTGDDLIGLFGDRARTGKSNSGDILQGKKTLPVIFAYENAPDKDKRTLARLIGNKQASNEDFDAVRRIITLHGLDKTNQYMNEQHLQALDYISKCDFPDNLRIFLEGFVGHISRREY